MYPQNGPIRVTLTVDNQGNFTYTPSLLRVTRGQKIVFAYESHFEIMFRPTSPGDKTVLSDRDPELTITENTALGIYHYAAAVLKGDRVFIDSGCGDIAILK